MGLLPELAKQNRQQLDGLMPCVACDRPLERGGAFILIGIWANFVEELGATGGLLFFGMLFDLYMVI